MGWQNGSPHWSPPLQHVGQYQVRARSASPGPSGTPFKAEARFWITGIIRITFVKTRSSDQSRHDAGDSGRDVGEMSSRVATAAN